MGRAEVRNLAQRSAAAAKEIKTLIDDSVDKVASGTRLVDQAGATMQVVVDSIRSVADIIAAAEADTGAPVEIMKVDGGMTVNRDLMQFQADLLDREVVCANRHESTALGAAFAAGLGAGVWKSIEELRGLSAGDPERFSPSMTETERNELLRHWRKALDRSLGWVD